MAYLGEATKTTIEYSPTEALSRATFPIRAFRAFEIHHNKLESDSLWCADYVGHTIWNSKVNRAACTGGEHDKICRPFTLNEYARAREHLKTNTCSYSCQCGLYRFKDYQTVRNYLGGFYDGSRSHCIGVVSLWGAVVHHEVGYRAEYAQVEGIFKDFIPRNFTKQEWTEMVEHLCAKYNVPALKVPK